MADALSSLLAIVRKVIAPLDYHAHYEVTVVAQNGDGTLELKPDTDRIPGLSRVPIRYGCPGMTVKVVRGARCTVGFSNGDPGRPYAAHFEPGSLEELTLTATKKIVLDAPDVFHGQEADAAPVACQGDPVEMQVTLGTVGPAATVNGQAFVGTISFLEPMIGMIVAPERRSKGA